MPDEDGARVADDVGEEVGLDGGEGCGCCSLVRGWAVAVGFVRVVELDLSDCKSFVTSGGWLLEVLVGDSMVDAVNSVCIPLSTLVKALSEGLA